MPLDFEDSETFRFDPGWYSLATEIVMEMRKQTEEPKDLVERTGMLTKLGYKHPTWKLRFFHLKGNRLRYYKKKGGKLLGDIILNPFCRCTTVKERQDLRDPDAVAGAPQVQNGIAVYPEIQKANCLKVQVPGKRTYYAFSASPEDRDGWVRAIQSNIDYIRITPEGRKYMFDMAQRCIDQLGMDPDGTMIAQLRLVLEGRFKPQLDSFQSEAWYAIHMAASTGDLEGIEELVNKGADIEAANSTGGHPLHQAAAYNRLSIIQFLLSKGANINAVTDTGNSPLHLAARLGAKPATRVLLEHGANAMAKNQGGQTPKEVAATDEIRALIESFVQ